ncbi:MAG TPA: hypothetical protein VGL89_14340 [Candidatus Koribacter sp.]|jgi:tetratricopeptide (TPR) repeat protein
MHWKRIAACIALSAVAIAQSPKARENYDKALKEVERHNLVKAEKLLHQTVSDAPEWALAYSQLGYVYFLEAKQDETFAAYEHARVLDAKTHELTPEQRRQVNDNLGVAYGMSHQYDKSIAVLEAAIKDDPKYGEYEYNLACDYSEQGDLDKALAHLNRAWELRNSFKFPDATKDDSFRRWKDDPRFQEAAGKTKSMDKW